MDDSQQVAQRTPGARQAGPASVPELATAPVLTVAALLALLLVALSGRYGYGRDELYFLACGRHLAWGYPDQPALVPLIARLMSLAAPGSLVVLRLPSALASAALVVLTALLTRELGAAGPRSCLPLLRSRCPRSLPTAATCSAPPPST